MQLGVLLLHQLVRRLACGRERVRAGLDVDGALLKASPPPDGEFQLFLHSLEMIHRKSSEPLWIWSGLDSQCLALGTRCPSRLNSAWGTAFRAKGLYTPELTCP